MGQYKPKTSRRELLPAQRALIVHKYQDGATIADIHREFKTPRSTIRSILDRYQNYTGFEFKNKPRCGVKPKLNLRQERALIRHADKNPKDSLFALATPSKSGVEIGRNLVRKVLKKYGKAKRKPRTKPYISPINKKKRGKFCRAEKKGKRNWNKMCWSDEVTFYTGADNTVFWVTRASGKGEEWLEKNLKPSFKSGRQAVGVWSCFCGPHMGPLVIIPKGGTMTAERYKEVLREHFIPFYKRMRRLYGPEVVMQEDNAPWHKAKLVADFLQAQKVKTIRWPPQSPDLSPIENLWAQIKTRIGKIRHRTRTLSDLEAALHEVWPQISPDSLLRLNESMPKRLDLCIKNKGGATKY
jgi:transposase